MGRTQHGRACVVIVDDEPGNVMLLERLLRASGIVQVHSVTDPREAVARCLEVGADLVLLDLHMPHLDGFAVLANLRSALPEDTFLPVVMLTADVTDETRERALGAGAKDFLTKPFDHTEVILRVANLLETRALYTQVQDHNLALQTELQHRRAEELRVASERRRRQERINQVLADDVVSMVFQPIADLQTGQIVGVEALARFDCEPQRPPNEWFDEAASIGMGPQLELAVLGAAFDRFGHLEPELFLSVNISPETALHPQLAELLDAVTTDRVVLELTEHSRVEDYQPLVDSLRDLRGLGVRVAVDDAGAGYAGLRHILKLRPDILKLDLELTRGIDTDPARRALATAMVAFADELDANVIAEGIETLPELETLRALDVPTGQGYYIARPGQLPLPDSQIATVATSRR